MPDKRGSFTFWDLKDYTGMNSSDLVKALWDLCWEGEISNDRFEAVRTGILNKFKAPPVRDQELNSGRRRGSRSGYSRWINARPTEGRWFITDSIPADEDLIEKDARLREVIRQLFSRYGVLFRQLLEKETDPLSWNTVFRTLRLMELSGECAAGYFFDSIPGLQFASWDALRILAEPLNESALYWMNCTDPASLAGVKLDVLKGSYPARLATSHMVFRGDRAILYSRRNGRDLTFFTGPQEPDTLLSLSFFKTLLTRDFQPLKSIKVETINDNPAGDSPYKKPLIEGGFRENFDTLIFRCMG
jgi:ATP-dependent Lhr-like helicase